MNLRPLLILTFVSQPFLAFLQQRQVNIDSLKNEIQTTLERDTNTVLTLTYLAYLQSSENHEEALYYAREAVKTSVDLDFPRGLFQGQLLPGENLPEYGGT